jgi:hypothetical protein
MCNHLFDMPNEFLRPALFVVGMVVCAILGYIQGRKDEKLSWLLVVHKFMHHPPKPTPPSSRPGAQSYCMRHEHWYTDHCPDCTLPSERP